MKYSIIIFLLVGLFSFLFSEEFSFKDKSREEIMQIVKDTWKYLKKNSSKISFDGKYSPLSVLDKDINPGAMFFHGEIHNHRNFNLNISLQMVHHLISKTDRLYFMLERDPAGIYMINKFIETGDKTLLERMYSVSKESSYLREGIPVWYLDEIRSISLHFKKEIRFIGVDMCGDTLSAMQTVIEILDKQNLTSKTTEEIRMLKGLYTKMKNYYDTLEDGYLFNQLIKHPAHDEFRNILSVIDEEMQNAETQYRKVLGDFNFNYLNVIIKNIKITSDNRDRIYSSNTERLFFLRDDIMYKTFLEFHTLLPQGIFYCAFGMQHVYQKPYALKNEYGILQDNYVSFLSLLSNNPDSPVKEKVFGIMNMYGGISEMEQSLTVLFSQSVAEKGWRLYRLSGEEKYNPFTRYSFLQDDLKPSERTTIDFIKYIIYAK